MKRKVISKQSRVFQKDKRVWKCCLCLLTLLILLGILWHYQTSDLPGTTVYEHPQANIDFGELTASHSLIQEFDFRENVQISDLSILMAMYGRVNHCQVVFTLYLNEDEVYHYVIDNAASMADNSYFTLKDIDINVTPEDKLYLLITSPDGEAGNAVTVWTDTASDEGTMYVYDSVNGVAWEAEGSIACSAKTVFDHRLSMLNIVVFVCAALFMTVIFVLLFLSEIKIEHLILVIVITIGLLYTVVMTPMSIPDEVRHYQVAYKLSNYMLFQWDSIEYGDEADFDYHGLTVHYNAPAGYIRVMEDMGQPAADGDDIPIPFPSELSYFVEYIPQAVGLSIGRLLGLNFVVKFYLGRIFNLLFYAACCYFAVKRMPKFKLLLGVLCITPMALQLAGSLSLDAFINGISYMLIAEMFRGILGTGPLSKTDYIFLVLLGALLAPTKVVYVLIMALAILIPAERFGGGKRKARALACAMVICAVTLAVFQLSGVAYWLGTKADQTGMWRVVQNYSISFLLHHPLASGKVFFNTIRQQGYDWFMSSMGYHLSGNSMLVPKWAIYGFVLLAVLSVLEEEDNIVSWRERTVFLSVSAAIVLLAMLSMFIGYTAAGTGIIIGVQGRYFIPILPLLFIVIRGKTLALKRSVFKFCMITAVLINIYVISYALSQTLLTPLA